MTRRAYCLITECWVWIYEYALDMRRMAYGLVTVKELAWLVASDGRYLWPTIDWHYESPVALELLIGADQ